MISDSVPAQTPEPEPTGGEPSITSASRPRWLFPGAAAVVVLAVAIGLVAGMTLTNRAGAGSGTASYVPADAAIYYELRLDLPGDQRPALRSFLGHFPLLQVDKYLTDELDQQLDQLSSAAPSGYRYSTDVKPWFDGKLGFALVRYPSMIKPTREATCSIESSLTSIRRARPIRSRTSEYDARLSRSSESLKSPAM